VALGVLLLHSAGIVHAFGADQELLSRVLRDRVRGGLVDYASLSRDGRLDDYIESLRTTDPDTLASQKDRMAFWINAYNALTLNLVIEHLPLRSIRDIAQDGMGPWDIPVVEIAGIQLTLNAIENEILRKEFAEPRIHMALVCAARSCPALREEAYTGATLERQLEDNTRRFMRDTTKNRYESSTGTLWLSEIFSWFAGDFAAAYGTMLEFARRYYPIAEGQHVVIRYVPYDWSLNAIEPDPHGKGR